MFIIYLTPAADVDEDWHMFINTRKIAELEQIIMTRALAEMRRTGSLQMYSVTVMFGLVEQL